MRLEWLEDILAIAETGSLSEAAERRRLTQSAFSRRIQKIEEFVGIQLVDRTRKPIQLRPTTLDQRDQIARLAAQLRQLGEDLRRGDQNRENRVVIASQHALTTAFTPGLIRTVEAEQKDIYVRLRSANLDDCISLLLARKADIALVYRIAGGEVPIQADYIETAMIGHDRLVPVLNTDADDLGDSDAPLPYIAYPAEVFFGDVLDRVLFPELRSRLTLVPKVETALTLAALELAEKGIGVAWVPRSLAAPRIESGRVADLSDRLPYCPLEIVAMRLAGQAGSAEMTVWGDLIAAQRIVMETGDAGVPEAP